ncbi:spinster family MFS transporter [Phenylobacterium sp.]|uniref:spinster family MFS transporter n=1 Tax=Phenylobacterium sp. TaxID=1871053 RepID=UPI0039837B97
MTEPGRSEGQEPADSAYSYYVVGVLMLAYMFSFIDRTLLSLVLDPVRKDLDLSETQVSLLAGFAFAAFYTVLGLPFGRWADTRRRRNLIALGIGLWSLATFACGLASSFWQLFVGRMFVGVGEATLAPGAYSMLPDYFRRERLGFAMSLFTCGITIGGGLAMLLGGVVVEWAQTAQPDVPFLGPMAAWQVPFLIVGPPGVLVALLVLFTVKEPKRRVEPGATGEALPIREVMAYLAQHWRTFTPVFLGFTGIVITGYAFNVWGPVYFMRVHGLSPTEVGLLYAGGFGVAGTAGVLAGGWLSDRATKRGRANGPIWVSLWSAILQAPLFIGAYLSPSAPLAMLLFCAALGVGSVYGGLQGTAIQALTPNRMRGQVGALYLIVANMIGLGLAPTWTAMMTEHLFGGPQFVGQSLALTTAIGLTVAIILLTVALKPARVRIEALAAR